MTAPEQSATLPPRFIVDSFREAYARVHGREPAVRYMGNHWFSVNSETVHRATLMQEIVRLREYVAQQQVVQQPRARADRGMIHKLIAKLRGL